MEERGNISRRDFAKASALAGFAVIHKKRKIFDESLEAIGKVAFAFFIPIYFAIVGMKLDLVKARRDGNRLYYRANTENPLFPEIRNLVLKTAGLVEVIKSALDREGIEVAFIFGSLARSKERAESDVDLMVIGTIGLRSLSSRLAGVSEQIGREINPHALSIEEFRRRKQNGNHFLSNVIESPKLFIIGSENDLETMGR